MLIANQQSLLIFYQTQGIDCVRMAGSIQSFNILDSLQYQDAKQMSHLLVKMKFNLSRNLNEVEQTQYHFDEFWSAEEKKLGSTAKKIDGLMEPATKEYRNKHGSILLNEEKLVIERAVESLNTRSVTPLEIQRSHDQI